MRLPKVTITYQEEETYALGKISVTQIVGFGIHWGWMYAWLYLFALRGSDLFARDAPEFGAPCVVVALATLAVVLFCYAAFFAYARKLFYTTRRRIVIRSVGAVLVVFAMALSFAADGAPAAVQVALGVASGLLSGFGGAILLMSFGVSFSMCDMPTAIVCMAFAMPVATATLSIVAYLFDTAFLAGCLVCLCLPLIEMALLHECSTKLVDNLEFSNVTMPTKQWTLLKLVGPACLAFGIPAGILRAAALGAPPVYSVGELNLAVFLASVLAGGVTLAAMLTKRKTNGFLFRTMPPVIALMLAIPVFVQELNDTPGFSFCLFSAYMLLICCVWAWLADASQRLRLSAFHVFGFGWGALSAGEVVGQLLIGHPGLANALVTDPDLIAATAFVCITLGVAILPSDSELRGALARGRWCPALVDLDAMVPDEKPVVGEARAIALEKAGSNWPAREPAAQAQPATQPPAQPEPAVKPAAQQQAHSDPAPQQAQPKGRFKRKCSAVAERYLLSRKETEVLFLLAKGYKSAAIQEALFISEGTTNTHMRHIYRKLDVHSQSELMALIDAEEVEDVEF